MTNQEIIKANQKGLEAITLYFPYEVKCLYFDDERGIEQICTIEELSKDEATLVSNEYDYYAYLKDVNLILRPLSDLTKPCLEGGKVPIVELAKMILPDEKWDLSNNKCAVSEYNAYELDYFNDMFLLYTPNNGLETFSQLQLFQQLYKWHFWLGDQSEFGKSIIDINTVE